MKRLRFLPSVLMLVACMAVLCVGVFSIKPIENTIGGTINISAGKASIQISAFINDFEYDLEKDGKTVGGINWDLTNLDFNVAYANSPEVAPMKVIRLRVQNLGSSELGAYFYTGEGLDANGLATYASLMHEDYLCPAGSDDPTVKTTFSTYTYIPANGYVDMYAIVDIIRLSDEPTTINFTYKLRVEDYVPNVTTLDTYNGTHELVKFSSKVNGANRTSASVKIQNNEYVKVPVIPTSITRLVKDAFKNCANLEHINFTGSLAQGTFDLCPAIKSMNLSAIPYTSVEIEDYGTMNYYNQNLIFGESGMPSNVAEYYEIEPFEEYGSDLRFYAYVPKSLKTLFLNGDLRLDNSIEMTGFSKDLTYLILGKGDGWMSIVSNVRATKMYLTNNSGTAGGGEFHCKQLTLAVIFEWETLADVECVTISSAVSAEEALANMIIGTVKMIVVEKGPAERMSMYDGSGADVWMLNGVPMEESEAGGYEFYRSATQDNIYVRG